MKLSLKLVLFIHYRNFLNFVFLSVSVLLYFKDKYNNSVQLIRNKNHQKKLKLIYFNYSANFCKFLFTCMYLFNMQNKIKNYFFLINRKIF